MAGRSHVRVSAKRSILSSLHSTCYIRDIVAKTCIAYRGQQLPFRELSKLKVGQLITMNGFVSASLSKQVALIYAGDGSNRPKMESVLFAIHIDNRIGLFSTFHHIEKES
ncbi:unnamed protein product [Didymodactylos carnosus]|uniref:Uncharacterized protein n=1 Tax=Didymodactylos carnosus TaxID=1234261 RepID=A0A815HBY9_9BILA|nr:unnamed protein product [Didymodactylos carnosus]CAF4219743.1 unnamed protein product [Didymodactylos carnosus]